MPQNGIYGLAGDYSRKPRQVEGDLPGILHLGKQGPPGPAGPQGPQGIPGPQGEQGPQGETGAAGYSPVRGIDYWTDNDKQEILSEVFSSDEMAQIKQDILDLRADFEYTGIKITDISINYTRVELGLTVGYATIYWSLNKAPKTQTVNGEFVPSMVMQWSEPNVSSDRTYTLRVTDERDAEATASVSIRFLNGVYYGVAENPEILDSAFILRLAKELSNTKGRTITVNAAEGQRIWYALPARLGDCSFAVGGFSGGFDLVDTIEFTNAYNYTEEYNVYASAKTGLGATKVVVS